MLAALSLSAAGSLAADGVSFSFQSVRGRAGVGESRKLLCDWS